MKAPSSLQTRWGLSPRQESAANMPPLPGEGSDAHSEAQLAGEGAAGGGGGGPCSLWITDR